jgi:hypothetical protein
MAAKFEVYNDKVGKFRFRVKSGNGTGTVARFRVPDRVDADRQWA